MCHEPQCVGWALAVARAREESCNVVSVMVADKHVPYLVHLKAGVPQKRQVVEEATRATHLVHKNFLTRRCRSGREGARGSHRQWKRRLSIWIVGPLVAPTLHSSRSRLERKRQPEVGVVSSLSGDHAPSNSNTQQSVTILFLGGSDKTHDNTHNQLWWTTEGCGSHEPCIPQTRNVCLSFRHTFRREAVGWHSHTPITTAPRLVTDVSTGRAPCTALPEAGRVSPGQTTVGHPQRVTIQSVCTPTQPPSTHHTHHERRHYNPIHGPITKNTIINPSGSWWQHTKTTANMQ